MKRLILCWGVCAGLLLAVPATTAATYDDIKNAGQILVCAFDNRLPYSTSSGDMPGLQIELAGKIAEELDVALDVRWIFYRFHARRAGCDMQMGTVARAGRGDDDDDDDDDARQSASGLRNVAGQQIFNLRQRVRPMKSDPYFTSTTNLVASQKLAGATSFSDLSDYKVAALHGSWAHFLLDQNNVTPVTRYETEMDILAAIDKGEVDAGIVASTYTGWYRKITPGAGFVTVESFDLESEMTFNIAVSLRGADQVMVDRVNAILAGLKENGWLSALYQKYGIAYRPPQTAE